MLSLTFEQFKERAGQGNLIPVFQQIPADLDTPVSAFMKIATGKNDFLLESVVGGERFGRYSFLGAEPREIIRISKNKIERNKGGQRESIPFSDNPLLVLRKILQDYSPVADASLPRFFGGLVGYMTYDMARYFEKLPEKAKDDLNLADAVFLLTDTVVIFDNSKLTMQIVCNVWIDPTRSLEDLYQEALHKIEKLSQKLKNPCPRLPASAIEGAEKIELKPSYNEEEYCALVEQAKEYIKAGDIFQVQISTRFEATAHVHPLSLYRAIRRINPSPYLYFLELDDMAIVGASPELMVRLEGGKAEVRPIAGTRRRGRTEQEDRELTVELQNDPKEKAEHIMLVDLGRNDLGRVCESGSVKVDELEVVENYAHVMHLVSHVSGKLKAGLDAFDLLQATFPAGTLTGAPKIRAMEIIEELEKVRRGIYGGCVGYIGFTGNMDVAITIRTALLRDRKVYVQAAGGIVYDSVPRLEYKECNNKARSMLEALKSLSD